MFVTFNSSLTPTSSPSPTSSRPRRTNVARACDWCRLNRIKCDDHHPCKNCRTRRVNCTKGRLTEQASDYRELERLRSRVAELEEQLKTPPSPTDSTVIEPQKWTWQGIWMQDRYYGPTSLNYFVHRLGICLESSPSLAESLLCSNNLASINLDSFQSNSDLSRHQEEHLLGQFWQSYHCITPIVDEDELRSYHDSLWLMDSQPSAIRKSSALMDIILALCMQYSAGLMADGPPDLHDGQWLYHRCQLLLSNENSSIFTLQCRIYSAIYLLNASCLDQCRSHLSIAVNIAYTLGLNHEHPSLSPSEQGLRRRIWWTLFFLDAKLSLELGRPYLINLSEATVKLDEPDINEDITQYDYQIQYVKLIMRVRSISSNILSKATQLMSRATETSIHTNNPIIQQCSTILRSNMDSLQTWQKSVPSALKIPRKGPGDAFSTTKSLLDIDSYAPLWLQRHRVMLELLYHNLVMYIYRPFIRLTPISPSQSIKHITDGNALLALSHAVATINIVHQVLTETDILTCWHRAFQYTWDAIVTVLGFATVHPVCPYTFSARKAITLAVEAFETFVSYGFTRAASAAVTVRDIHDMIDSSAKSFGNSMGSSQLPTPSESVKGADLQNMPTPDFASMVNSLASPTSQSNIFDANNLDIPSIPVDLLGLDQSWWDSSIH